MTSFSRTLCAILSMGVLLSACARQNFSDLDEFMASKRDRPGGVIAPIPTFKAYEAFSYSATTLRSPFDRPVDPHPPDEIFVILIAGFLSLEELCKTLNLAPSKL